MKRYLYFMLMLLIFLMFYRYLNIDICQTSKNYRFIGNNGQAISSNIIVKDGLLRMQILDKKYYSNMKHLPFITIFEKKAIFINEGNPIKLFKDNYIFSNKSKKLIYINSVKTKKDTIFFTGFNFANLNLGAEKDTFKVYKIFD
jgi:hypothetical protein